MGGSITIGNDVVTPDRSTRILFDVPEQIAIEDYWNVQRLRGEVCPAGAANGGLGNFSEARFWKSVGAWTLKPLTDYIELIHERYPYSVSNGMVYRPDATSPEFQVLVPDGGGVRAVSGHRKPEGVDADAAAPDSSDTFIQKFVQYLGSGSGVLGWEQTIETPASPVLSPPTVRPSLVPMDTQAITNLNLPEDRAVFVRFSVPGSLAAYPGEILTFYFAQYAVIFQGNGKAQLHEYARKLTTGNHEWVFRTEFRYASGSVAGNTHTIAAFPMMGPAGERYIVFHTPTAAQAFFNAGVLSVGASHTNSAVASDEFAYQNDPALRVGYAEEVPPGGVTRAGTVSVSVRRDLRIRYQFGPVLFVPSGLITDQPFQTPYLITPRPFLYTMYSDWRTRNQFVNGSPIGVPSPYLTSDNASGYVVADDLIDKNGNHVDPTDVAANSLAGTIAPTFTMLGIVDSLLVGDIPAVRRTPVFWGYKIAREAVVQTITPGQFETPMNKLSLSGDEGDPRQIGGSLELFDPGKDYPRLQLRSSLSCRVVVDWTPPAEAQTTTALFRGYAKRITSPQLGKYDNETFHAFGTHEADRNMALWNQDVSDAPLATGPPGKEEWPKKGWRSYDILLTGMHDRLNQKTTRTVSRVQEFLHDPTAPKDANGITPPWKVTDIIRFCLSVAGFPSHMIAIQDNPIRLWMGLGTNESDAIIDGNTSLLERCITLARAYLGAYLIFDAASGTEGEWRLIIPPPEGSVPVAHFTRFGSSGAFIPPHRLDNYPANTFYTIGDPVSRVVEPEANHLWIFTAPNIADTGANLVELHFYNHLSYNVPGGYFPPADPESPHFCPTGEKLLIVSAPELWTGQQGSDGIALTRNALRLVGHRIFNYSCRARVILPVQCPLPFIYDTTIGDWRMLRFGDPVTVDGEPEWGETDWFVRSCAPEYEHDVCQMAQVQLEKLIPYP